MSETKPVGHHNLSILDNGNRQSRHAPTRHQMVNIVH
jgi:hypothetical protein